LSSGFIEEALKTILREYARHTAVTTSGYVIKQLDYFRNPKTDYIRELVRAFDETWGDAFSAKIEGEFADAVDSIVNNRNRIAHGLDVGISYGTVSDYYRAACEVIKLIDDHFQVPRSMPRQRGNRR
jgi:hypothetical protein